jgi:hypothetical protein
VSEFPPGRLVPVTPRYRRRRLLASAWLLVRAAARRDPPEHVLLLAPTTEALNRVLDLARDALR